MKNFFQLIILVMLVSLTGIGFKQRSSIEINPVIKDSIIQVAKGITQKTYLTLPQDETYGAANYPARSDNPEGFDSAAIYSMIDCVINNKLKAYESPGYLSPVKVEKTHDGIAISRVGQAMKGNYSNQYIDAIRFTEDWYFDQSKGTFTKQVSGVSILKNVYSAIGDYMGNTVIMYIKFNN